MDSGLLFERQSGAGGSRTVTLEPRLMYVYIPYRNQDQLPEFDTATPDPNLIELFQPNRYVGIDRIGDANQITWGLGSKLFENVTGARYLSAAIGQTFYFTTPKVLLPNELPGNHRSSDLIAELNISAYRHWNLQFNIATSSTTTQIDQTELALQYQPQPQAIFNLAYRYRKPQADAAGTVQPGTVQQSASDVIAALSAAATPPDVGFEQLDASAAWPLNRHWDVYARAVKSLQASRSIEGLPRRAVPLELLERTAAGAALDRHPRRQHEYRLHAAT